MCRRRPRPLPASRYVLVAGLDLPPGHFIGQESLRWQAWPDETMPENYIVRDGGQDAGAQSIAQLVGAVVRRDVSAGQPVTENVIVRPGDRGFLAAVLTPGMRAISVPVNDTTSVAGFVFPGDRVDLLLTHTVRMSGTTEGDAPSYRATETILTDVRVLAIDQRLTDPADGPRIPHTATIEVDPREAEMVQVMMQMGALSLSLRSLAPEGTGPDGEVIAKPRPSLPSSDPVRSLLTFVQGQLPEGTALTEPERTFTLDTEVSLLRGLVAAFNAMPQEQVRVEGPPPDVQVVRGSAGVPTI